MRKKTLTVNPPLDTFWELRLEGLPRSLEPSLSVWLFNQGCWGIVENLLFSQPLLRYEAKIKTTKLISITAYFDPRMRDEMEWKVSRWLQSRSPLTRMSWELQANQDWLKEWKKYFKPFSAAGLRFVPAWEVSKLMPRAKTVIIEPGMAFGTGTHATTRFAIEHLKKLSKKNKIKGKTILDVGAGSGILSVVAEKFGALKCLAIDNDPESWRECRKMFKLNKTKKCRVTEKQLHQIKKKYDVVVANIIDGVLMELKKPLLNALKPGGYLILSGILTDGASAFIKSFLSRTNCKLMSETKDEEWTSLIISK
ncbi:MAG: 50S ribosomal protein L11 methyltransferase [Oligoflexia bacterium]|nr:50S ribosomal protein L11 methyltransferase [Oligoflexia bacterium]